MAGAAAPSGYAWPVAPYRVGIVGLGRMGRTIDDEGHHQYAPFAIAAACSASPLLQVVAGCDLLAERRSAFAARWGVDAVYEDAGEMLAAESLDMVAICTTASGLLKPADRAIDHAFRGDAHADLTVAAVEAGLPMVYVEKAMASSLERADEVRDAVHAASAAFNSGVLRRFDRHYQQVRDAIAEGVIGDPIAVVHYAPTTLLHGHIHSIDTISLLLGDPPIDRVRGELVSPASASDGRHVAADPRATYQLRFTTGVEAWSVPAAYWEFEVIGVAGSIRSLDNGGAVVLRSGDRDAPGSWRQRPMPEQAEAQAGEDRGPVVACLEDLVAEHEGHGPTLGNVALTHHITEACLAVAESHLAGGGWLSLPLERRDLYVFHI